MKGNFFVERNYTWMPSTLSPFPTAALEELEKSLLSLSDIHRNHQNYIRTKYKLNGLEMEILQFIALEGPQRMKDIGEHFHVKLSTLTSIIDKVENQRMVKRVNSREDRRVVYLELTRKGQQVYQQYSRLLQLIGRRVRQQMSDPQFESLLFGLDEIANELNTTTK